MKFLLRVLGIFVAVMVTIYLIPGLGFTGTTTFGALAALSLIIALLNATLKPLLQLLSLPITVLSLGVFYLIVNAALLYLAAAIFNEVFAVQFVIASFGDAFVGSIIISLVSAIMNAITGANE